MRDLQTPFDAAVVVPTTLRPTLDQAIRSVFDQDLAGRVQILIGVDRRVGDADPLTALAAECPDNMALTVIDPGYSTARHNGGIHDVICGGGLRTALSFLANSRFVAYLDDDNWFAPDHLASLKHAIDGVGWAWSLRRFVDAGTGEDLGIDRWDSVGPDAGVFAATFGGLVDTNCLMIDAVRCADILWRWSRAAGPNGTWEDRQVFRGLRSLEPGRGTGRPTVCYRLDRARQDTLAGRVAGPTPRASTRRVASLIDVSSPMIAASAEAPRAHPGAIHAGYRLVLSSKGAASVIDVGAGNGASTVALALAAREAGLAPIIAAIEPWAIDDGAAIRGAFAQRVASLGLEGTIRTIATAPCQALARLARLGVTIDVARIAHRPDGGHEEDLHDLLRAAWLVLRPGGAAMVDHYTLGRNAVLRGVGLFAKPRDLTVYTAGTEGARVFVLVKP